MPPDLKTSSSNDIPQGGSVPPPLPASGPPVSGAPPPLGTDSPPTLAPQSAPQRSAARQLVAVLLSACLALFLADAAISLLDDTLILLFGIHLLAGLRGIVCTFAMLVALVVYALMGLTPMIPKRLFLPLTLFNPLAALALIPLAIFCFSRVQQFAWLISLAQVIIGLSILYLGQGDSKLRWLPVTEKQLEARRFNWRNLSVFLLVNLFVLLPAIAIYLVLCAALAVNHFSDGFLALRPGGLTVQVRSYVRGDGKTIQLFPMSHIGEPEFYRQLTQSFPTNSIILMEGVSDEGNLLTNEITYKRMATSLGLAEQQKEFKPTRGKLVRADVDVAQFTTNTIGFLNFVMLIHAKGLNAETVLKLLQFSPPPQFEEQLWDDLLRKRKRLLLEEIRARLPETEHIIVPWGVAHMPEIAREIQRSGFHLVEIREYVAIRFGSAGKGNKRAGETSKRTG